MMKLPDIPIKRFFCQQSPLQWISHAQEAVDTALEPYQMENSLSLLDCFNFSQFVNVPTLCKCHALDLVITNVSILDVGLSDHSAIFFNI